MKFPITRESLQAFDYVKDQKELQEEALEKVFATNIEHLCNEFKRSMRSNLTEKKYVWRQVNNVREHLPQFIEKLKAVFIGCDIIIDPLKTYLIIDWS